MAGLPDGLDTLLGAGGTRLSAGEEQSGRLRAVADPRRAGGRPRRGHRADGPAHRAACGRGRRPAAQRPHRGAHRAPAQHHPAGAAGGRARPRAGRPAGRARGAWPAPRGPSATCSKRAGWTRVRPSRWPASLPVEEHAAGVGGRRRTGPPPEVPEVGTGPSLARGIVHALSVRPAWGVAGAALFLAASLTGAQGAVTGLLWGSIVVDLDDGVPWPLVGALVVCLLASPLMLADAFWRYPRWWVEVLLRTRMAVLRGQTDQRRLPRTPPGEVVARSMDADRYARYADRWVDFVNGIVIAAVTALLAGTVLAGAVLMAVLVVSALASALGRPIAGRSAAAASAARARFGRAVVSTLEAARTVKPGRGHPAGAGAPARGRRWPGGRRGARAPGAGGARRRPHADGAGRSRGGLGGLLRRRLGPRHDPAGGQRGGGLRLVRPGRRHGRHRGTGHAGVAARDQPVRRRRGPDGRGAGRGPGLGSGAGAGRGAPGAAGSARPGRLRGDPRRRDDRRARRGPHRPCRGAWCCSSARSVRASPACWPRWRA
ncbi:hypothetical protein [Nocardioides convexus]|uniref:hypothetical protein n=1 Tax=Nocardioides convexus TaxID=2712224 RepID=UPI0024183972|nr:hypothetical protein [Nocardioides convexus]